MNTFLNKYRKIILAIVDIFVIVLCFFGAFLLRFDFTLPEEYSGSYFIWLPLFIFVKLSALFLSGLYKAIWRYTSLWELINLLKTTTLSSLIIILCLWMFSGLNGFPRSIFLLDYILTLGATCLTRISVRVYYTHFHKRSILNNTSIKKKLLLIGAGNTGEKIAREIINSPKSLYSIVGFIDDDPNKKNALLHGYQVLGKVSDIEYIKIQFDEILITAPSASGEQIRRIVNLCKSTGKNYKIVPTLSELIDGEISLSSIRDVSYVDLLGRDEVNLDRESIDAFIKGKRVLITGAGGSIGSELVRQCLIYDPSELICIDNSEENLFNISSELEKIKSQTIIKTILGNINEKQHMEKIINDLRPQVIFHAAAYKHVPIQELHPWAAVKTNIGGTLNLVELSDKYKIEKFVLVSTDKAVNPVNVMGATKRLSEKLIQSIDYNSDTQFIAVRFGNVIGSSGSAIPTFQKQINTGGPVTITHPEMTRYFMSIQEAAQLILQTGSYGGKGKIFLLDMGKPIKIVDLAKDLIRLSGLEPEKDISIVYSGLRPGEKLYEELQSYGEKVISSDHKKIMVLDDSNHIFAWDAFKSEIKDLLAIAEKLDIDKIQSKLSQLLPDYKPRSFVHLPEEDLLDPFAVKGQA